MKLITLLSIFIIITNVLFADTTTVDVAADAYVRGGVNGDTNYGSETTINVKNTGTEDNHRRGYLKFKLDNYQLINNTKLKLYVTVVQYADPDSFWIDVYECSDTTWTEGGITWNNQPSLTDSITSFKVNYADAESWIEVDLRSQFHYRNNDYVTIALEGKTSGIEQSVGFSAIESVTLYESDLDIDTTIYNRKNRQLCIEERNWGNYGSYGKHTGWTHYFDYATFDTIKTVLHNEDNQYNDSSESALIGRVQYMCNCTNLGSYNVFVFNYRKNEYVDSLTLYCNEDSDRMRFNSVSRTVPPIDSLVFGGFDETGETYTGLHTWKPGEDTTYFRYETDYIYGIANLPGTDTLYCASVDYDSIEIVDMGTWTRVGIFELEDTPQASYLTGQDYTCWGITIIDTTMLIGYSGEQRIYEIGLRGHHTLRSIGVGNYFHKYGNIFYGIWTIKERLNKPIGINF